MNEKNLEERFRQLCFIFPERIQRALLLLEPAARQNAQEIRLRVGGPLHLYTSVKNLFITLRGQTLPAPAADSLVVTADEIWDTFRAVCGYSVHSHQSEIAQGYVTITGGHRVGLCGTAVLTQGQITGMRDISSLNIRIAKQVTGCADKLLAYTKNGCKGVLLAGEPSSGKTTMLRDLARQLATGAACAIKKVALVDERGELAAVWQGIPQNDVGITADVLNGYSKGDGIAMAVRTLSPEVIICDEIGTAEDIAALKAGATCGVKLIATVHASSIEEVLKKPFVRELAELGAFETIVLLAGGKEIGTIKQVLDLGEFYDKNDGLPVHPQLQCAGGAKPLASVELPCGTA